MARLAGWLSSTCCAPDLSFPSSGFVAGLVLLSAAVMSSAFSGDLVDPGHPYLLGAQPWMFLVPSIALVICVVARQGLRKDMPLPADDKGSVRGDPGYYASGNYEDPLRWSFIPTNGTMRANTVERFESESCEVLTLAMHRPTHEPWRELTQDYPYSWHFAGRRRLWEVRMQIRFKVKPEGQLYFGMELPEYIPVSSVIRNLQRSMVGACRSIMGPGLYHSVGDDPARAKGECELPILAMPMWAIDQFAVSEPGEEPDITADCSHVGMKRTDGFKAYVRAMNEMLSDISTEKVYTLLFWGTSQFADVINWTVWGGVPKLWLDINKFCGSPPLQIAMYDLKETGEDEQRHLQSRKRYFMRVALWSENKPPKADSLERRLGGCTDAQAPPRQEQAAPVRKKSGLLKSLGSFSHSCCAA